MVAFADKGCQDRHISLAKKGLRDSERVRGLACRGGVGSGASSAGRHTSSSTAEGQQGSSSMGWDVMGWDGVG